jgi:hypothetical protein
MAYLTAQIIILNSHIVLTVVFYEIMLTDIYIVSDSKKTFLSAKTVKTCLIFIYIGQFASPCLKI